MTTINLLPDDFSSKGGVKIARVIKKILIPVFAVFFISVAAMSGIIIVLNSNLKRVTDNQEILINSIKNLEKTERGMLLLQERLSKIKNILATDSSKGKITQNLQDVLGRSSGVTVSEIKLNADKINLGVEAVTSDQVGEFLSQILEDPLFQEVVLTDFTFSQEGGYRLGLDLTTK
ncbi:MAG: hypothetical protein Q8P91_00475 [bacterium]|nr:hypothetical protein [bacterium]